MMSVLARRFDDIKAGRVVQLFKSHRDGIADGDQPAKLVQGRSDRQRCGKGRVPSKRTGLVCSTFGLL